MFKGTQVKQDRLKRVASSSTKPHAGGRVDTLPPEAKPFEETYNSLKHQYEAIRDTLKSIQGEMKAGDLSRRHLIHHLEGQAKELRELARHGGELPYCIVFYYVARNCMSWDLFLAIDQEVGMIMGRTRHEVPAPIKPSSKMPKHEAFKKVLDLVDLKKEAK